MDAEKKQPALNNNSPPVVFIRQYCYPVMVQVPNQNLQTTMQQNSHPVMQQFLYPSFNSMPYQIVQPTTPQQYYHQTYLQPLVGNNYMPISSNITNYQPEIIIKQMQICLPATAPISYQEPQIIESHNFIHYNQLTGAYYNPLNGYT